MILFMVFVILGIILLFSVKLADNPYRRIWVESLSFDKVVKSELTSVYADKKKAAHMINLVGIGLIAIGLLLCPLIAPAEIHVLDDMILAGGMILAGIGAFLCIYVSGIVRAYRLLIRNEEYHEKRK